MNLTADDLVPPPGLSTNETWQHGARAGWRAATAESSRELDQLREQLAAMTMERNSWRAAATLTSLMIS